MKIEDIKVGMRLKVKKRTQPDPPVGLTWCPEYEGRVGIVTRVDPGPDEAAIGGLLYRAAWLEPAPFAKGTKVVVRGPRETRGILSTNCISAHRWGYIRDKVEGKTFEVRGVESACDVCATVESTCGAVGYGLPFDWLDEVIQPGPMLGKTIEVSPGVRMDPTNGSISSDGGQTWRPFGGWVADRLAEERKTLETMLSSARHAQLELSREQNGRLMFDLADRDRRLKEAGEILAKMSASLERLRPKTLAEHAFAIRESFAHGLEAGAAARGVVVRFAKRVAWALFSAMFGTAAGIGLLVGLVYLIASAQGYYSGRRAVLEERNIAPVTTWTRRGVY